MQTYKEQAQEKLAEDVGDTLRGLYKHYKGGLYVVFSESVDEANGTILVHYYSLERRTRWTRTLENFRSVVQVPESVVSVPRFKWLRMALRDELFQAAFDNGEE